ncbi:MAG: SDR family NAD(P)-dependent oxidoreductase [Actinomycetota bacterium]
MRRVVLITGGAGGMGRAIASRFVGGDDTVVLADLSEEALTGAALEVPAWTRS